MKIKKIIGAVLYCIGKVLPESCSYIRIGQKQFRYLCAKLLLDRCGKSVNIERGAVFSTKCTIGDFSGIGINARIGIVHIGKNVMMGPECSIITRNHCFTETDIPMRCQGFYEHKPVYIDDDVWIGARVIILGGVKIGKGAIIGAGSVVTHDVGDYDIVAGNPARVIRNRKEQRTKKT